MSVLTRVFVVSASVILLWVVNSQIPMGGRTRNILNLMVVVLLIAWLLRTFGIQGVLTSATLG